MEAIVGKGISHSYESEITQQPSLVGIDITVHNGELIVILGCNGCGKSTLLRHINALIPLQAGELTVAELNVKNEVNIWKIRRHCGMVFQNPDNQFVSSVVDEDIAFGLENFNVPADEIPEKVKAALRLVGMEDYGKKSPQMLSGGQKQRIAIAGILAVEPDILLFDEATSMLDPEGRQEVLHTIKRLHEEQQKTIVMITHYIEEAVFSDRVYLMQGGRFLAEGTPRHILTDPVLLRKAGLLPPMAVQVYYDLQKAGIPLKKCPLTNEELVEEICLLL